MAAITVHADVETIRDALSRYDTIETVHIDRNGEYVVQVTR